MRWWEFYYPTRVKHFVAGDIRSTGASVGSVKRKTIYMLDKYVDISERSVVMLPGGLTTGTHASWTHPEGQAVDIGFREMNGVLKIRYQMILAANAGFTEIGSYWNGIAYGMHLGWGRVAQWARWRHHREPDNWHTIALIVDPKDAEMAARL